MLLHDNTECHGCACDAAAPGTHAALVQHMQSAGCSHSRSLPTCVLQTHTFCPRCGMETVPTEGGARRRCLNRPQHKQYPRTDPVVRRLH
jgi:NADH pyrophosphatase NudC (nudix superfamily)